MTRPSSRLRCTVITPYGTLGGSERWLLGLLDAGDRLDVEVWLLQDGPRRDELAARGVKVELLPTGPDPRSMAARSLDLVRRLRRSDTDVVLANGVKAATVAVPAARLAGVPVCWAKHDFSWDAELGRHLGHLADRVLATSQAVGAATRRADVVVVPPPRPTAAPEPVVAAREFWAGHGLVLDDDAPTLAMVSRLVAYKGVDTAVRALVQAPAWRLAVIGPDDPSEPDERARLVALAAELGVADRVTFVGEVDDVGRRLAPFDAVAVLTRAEGRFGWEGYSLVALEALTAGVPLVGAAGNPEVERMARAAGRVVPADDAAAVARALADLAVPATRASLREAAARTMAAHPDAAACASRTIATLADLAGRPGAGATGPPVTVLTCFRNEAGHVDGVVDAVLGQLGTDDEYLLLDDRSTDATPRELEAWAARDPRVRLLRGPGINLSAARNLGFSEATNDVVACTDAGCVPASTWLSALRAPFAEAPAPDLVVGVYEVDGGDPVRDASRLGLFPSIAEARRRTPLVRLVGTTTGRRFDRRRVDGRSMACSVEAWKRAGGFDPALFSSEDAVFGDAVLATGGTSTLALDAHVTWEQTGRLRDMAAMYAKYGEWGGRAGSWNLASRDLVRGSVYVVAPLLLARGGPVARAGVVAAASGYLAVPLARARAERVGPATLALIPAVVVLKDVAKAVGCLKGALARVREQRGRR